MAVSLSACTVLCALLAGTAVEQVNGIVQELYTTNAICAQHYCINPLFPGLEDLGRLETIQWQCSALDSVKPYLDFCNGALNYAPAIPSPNATSTSLQSLVQAQDDAAATMYYYHLAGMGMEAWDHAKPAEDSDECVKSVWQMVCYTYFPKSEAGCKAGESSRYLRPCQNTCNSYVAKCGVECCDESVQCVFSHNFETSSKKMITSTGYAAQNGPSALCTGGDVGSAHRASGLSTLGLLAAVALFFRLFA